MIVIFPFLFLISIEDIDYAINLTHFNIFLFFLKMADLTNSFLFQFYASR